jgi:hypothetical protein
MNGIEIQAVDRGFADTNGHAHIMAIIPNSLYRSTTRLRRHHRRYLLIVSQYVHMSPHHLTSLWCDSRDCTPVLQVVRAQNFLAINGCPQPDHVAAYNLLCTVASF